jgi:hypothetical protein
MAIAGIAEVAQMPRRLLARTKFPLDFFIEQDY